MADGASDGLLKATVVLRVCVAQNGVVATEYERLLKKRVEWEVGNGLLSGDTAVEVESWECSVSTKSDEGPSEGEAATWLQQQIESGNVRGEGLGALLARYAFTEPDEMRSEFAERMGMNGG